LYYSTNFPVAQNPISENGQFVTSTSPGVNWSGLELGAGGNLPVAPVDITAPGRAESVDYANPNYGDALAVLTGNWGANQSVSITVGDIPATSENLEEFEIHLRTDPTTGTGYEITWGYNHDYILIATWNGGGVVGAGAYTTLAIASGPQYHIAPGDTLTASIQGDVITMYTDGVQVAQITDSKFSSGNPGFGFNQGGTGEYGISSFSASSEVVCFLRGTLIDTPDGARPVESLLRGDKVSTADGQVRSVRWVWRQTVVSVFADKLRAYPIRIVAGALGENMPDRDLFLSPDHAILMDGCLIHAGALVNNTTILRVDNPETRFVYYHVELEDHSLILAHGVPAETFIDNVTRRSFDNCDEYEALYGDADQAIVEMEFPRAKSARQVPRVVRARVAARAEALLGATRVAA